MNLDECRRTGRALNLMNVIFTLRRGNAISLQAMKKLLKGLLVVAAVMAVWGWVEFRSLSPVYDFQLTTEAVLAPVNMVFDDHGIPHIYAEHEADAVYALGYVHASERLWQMDLLRRAGAGELAALLGEDMVENDRYLRTLGMREVAVKEAARFEAEAPDSLQRVMAAYLAGVNAYIGSGARPLEYRLVGAEPEPFTSRDVYGAAGFMAYSFAIHLKTEPVLDWMKHHLDSARYALLAVGQTDFTRIPNAGPPPSDLTSLTARVERLDALRPVPQWLGSNAWVLSGERTASGEVLFCNDAHMAYAQPSVWYEAHLVTPTLEYYGNHLAGIPFPVIGHTREHAWGITMFVNDDIDLYRERIDGNRYLHGGAWRDLTITEETIEVAGGDPVTFEVRKTHHGPLIEDSLSMWWAYTQYPENRIPEAFYGFSRGRGIDAFAHHASLIHAPGVNMMYGDAEGNIGWWASAKLPVRPDHVDTKTAIDGTDPANDPTGWHPFDRNPQTVNPARGFVYSANNAPEPRDSMRYPGHYYSGNTRAAGIFEALSAPKNDWTVADAQRLQLDDRSPVYAENARRMVALAQAAGETVDPVLLDWDGTHGLTDVAPTLYYRWMYRTIEGAMADEFEDEDQFEAWHRTIVSENTFPRLLRQLDSPWWDDVRTPEREQAAEVVAAALREARLDLAEALGEDAEAWHYGQLHTVTHRHAMADVPVVGSWLSVGPFALPASKDALNKYEFKLKREVDYSVFSGPSMRIAIDFADVPSAESVLPTGQSGNVFSPFYADQAPLYHEGVFRKQRMDRDDIEAHATATARIEPATDH